MATIDDQIIVRAKWSIDGAKTLAEAADMSRSFADYLDSLEKDGFQLIDKIRDDYGFVTPGGERVDYMEEEVFGEVIDE